EFRNYRMAKRRESAGSHRRTRAKTGTAATGGVHRAPVHLGRRFLQICLTAAAEALIAEGVTPAQLGVLVNLSPVTGAPDLDQNALAARLGAPPPPVSPVLAQI